MPTKTIFVKPIIKEVLLIPQEIIRKKRNGHPLSEQELSAFVSGLVTGKIPDYQVSALLMAIYFQGMSPVETSFLLKAMMESGIRFDWKTKEAGSKIFVDKHSTGGVGDKTSLIILPLLIAEGLNVPMIAGRGLGHTGGTLDKLESIPGVSTQLSPETFTQQVLTIGGAFGAQTLEFVPADKKLYALRDVTSTVESIPLIVASIMSKKLGEGIGALVLDVKFGSGSFMGSLDRAEELGKAMKAVGMASGCLVEVALTSMNQPLGRTAGHTLEVLECIEIMEGKNTSQDTKELSLQLAARLACLARKQSDAAEFQKTYERMNRSLEDGTALEIFHKVLVKQGAQSQSLKLVDRSWIDGETQKFPVFAKTKGKIQSIETRNLGLALLELGGGRKKTDDKINPCVGLSQILKIGEATDSSQPLCFVNAATEADFESVRDKIVDAFFVVDEKVNVKCEDLIHSWL
jgi:pyrimidine-nucleoside phosphorylase